MEVRTKAQMYSFLRSGRFGNTLRSWPSYGAMVESGFSGKIGLRCSGKAGGGRCAYDLNEIEAVAQAMLWETAGVPKSIIQWCEAAPDQYVKFQGEICQTEWSGYALHYSTVKAQMRPALAAGAKNHVGPGALLICKAAMDPASYEDLCELLEDFPDATVEFSCYSICLGAKKGRNTIFWEVRNF